MVSDELLGERRKALALSGGVFLPWLGDRVTSVSLLAWPSNKIVISEQNSKEGVLTG